MKSNPIKWSTVLQDLAKAAGIWKLETETWTAKASLKEILGKNFLLTN